MHDFLQLAGGLILAFGYIPQLLQLCSTRSSKDINLKTYIAITVGISLMEIYAFNLVRNGSGVMFAVTNTLSLVISCTITITIICLRLTEKRPIRQPGQRVKGKTCVYFRELDLCTCNNDPDDPGECIYQSGIETAQSAMRCKYFEGS